QTSSVGLEVLVVRVPAAEADLDGGDAGLDQAASHERGPAEIVVAVRLGQGSGLALEIEDLAFLGSHQAKPFFVDIVVSLGAVGELGAVFFAQVGGTAGGELVFQSKEQALAAADALFGFDAGAKALRGPNVFRRHAGVLDGEGSVGHAEEARAAGS